MIDKNVHKRLLSLRSFRDLVLHEIILKSQNIKNCFRILSYEVAFIVQKGFFGMSTILHSIKKKTNIIKTLFHDNISHLTIFIKNTNKNQFNGRRIWVNDTRTCQ